MTGSSSEEDEHITFDVSEPQDSESIDPGGQEDQETKSKRAKEESGDESDEDDPLQAEENPTAEILTNRDLKNDQLTKEYNAIKQAVKEEKRRCFETDGLVKALTPETEEWVKHARHCHADQEALADANKAVRGCEKILK